MDISEVVKSVPEAFFVGTKNYLDCQIKDTKCSLEIIWISRDVVKSKSRVTFWWHRG